MTLWGSLARITAVAAVFVALSLSVRACHSLPALKQHPVYSFVVEQGAPGPSAR
jgi:hypothetical protein